MIDNFPILSIIVGILMLASKTRRRFPCFAGGCASILAGGFFLSLPMLASAGAFGWLGFSLWILSLPIMVACLIALVTILRKDRTALPATILCGAAIATAVPPVIEFWSIAGLSIVAISEGLDFLHRRVEFGGGSEKSNLSKS